MFRVMVHYKSRIRYTYVIWFVWKFTKVQMLYFQNKLLILPCPSQLNCRTYNMHHLLLNSPYILWCKVLYRGYEMYLKPVLFTFKQTSEVGGTICKSPVNNWHEVCK
jgi:hypothetical protein